MLFPVVTDLANDGLPVTVSCRVLELSSQQRDRGLAEMATDVFDAHIDEPELGFRFLADASGHAGCEIGDPIV